MENKENGEVSFEAGGKTYTIKMTHRTAAVAEQVLGRPIFDVEGGGILYVASLLYAMIEGQHDVKTIDDAYSVLDDGDALSITQSVNEALTLFFLNHYQAAVKA